MRRIRTGNSYKNSCIFFVDISSEMSIIPPSIFGGSDRNGLVGPKAGLLLMSRDVERSHYRRILIDTATDDFSQLGSLTTNKVTPGNQGPLFTNLFLLAHLVD